MWRKGNPSALSMGMRISAATEESDMEIPQKIKNGKMDLPFDPAILHLGIYPKESKALIQKNISTPMFIVALLTIAKIVISSPSVHQQMSGSNNYGTYTWL